MDKKKKAKLEKAGWRVGSAEEFLDLTPEEAAYVELKLSLSFQLREVRTESGLSQVELAKKLGSSQSRVAKMEASDPSVSVDLLIKGLLAAGATKSEIGAAIAKTSSRRSRRATARGTAA